MFLLMYYIMGIFVLHAAFHMTQTDALNNVVLLFSLKETDVVEEKKKVSEEEIDEKKVMHEK